MYKVLLDKLYALLLLIGEVIGVVEREMQDKPVVPAPSGITVRPKTMEKTPSRVLYEMAVMCRGKDMAPKEDEYGCMEAVNAICYKAFGDYAGGDTSTYRAIPALSSNKKFGVAAHPEPGDIIIYPTGYGNGKVSNGHAGIVGEDGKVMSNDSNSGLWEQNYTLDTLHQQFGVKGGFPRYLFRRIEK